MPGMPTPTRLLLIASALALSSSSYAEESPAPASPPPAAAPTPPTSGPKLEVERKTLKVPGAAKATPPYAKMADASRDVTRGYYKALIAAKYDEAASFLHPSAIEPLRARVVEDLEKGPEKKTQNTLAALGIKDLASLRAMSLDDFYVHWAKSPYGQGVQVLSKKELAVDVVLEPPSCSQQRRTCEVNLKLRGLNEKGEKMESPSTVWVVEHEGRWLLTLKPPA